MTAMITDVVERKNDVLSAANATCSLVRGEGKGGIFHP